MFCYSSGGKFIGWKGISARELASVNHYDDYPDEVPSDEELYGEDEEEEDKKGD